MSAPPRPPSNHDLDPARLRLTRTARGQLVLHYGDQIHTEPRVRRAFPLEAAERFIGFFDAEGDEIGLLDAVDALDADSRQVLLDELDKVYFRPVITAFDDITEEFGTVRCQVQTSNGPREIQIRGIRSKIRLLSGHRATIEDVEGNRYLLKDWHRLPQLTREILGL